MFSVSSYQMVFIVYIVQSVSLLPQKVKLFFCIVIFFMKYWFLFYLNITQSNYTTAYVEIKCYFSYNWTNQFVVRGSIVHALNDSILCVLRCTRTSYRRWSAGAITSWSPLWQNRSVKRSCPCKPGELPFISVRYVRFNGQIFVG